MIKGMITQLVPARYLGADDIGIAFGIAADDEKSGFYIVFFKQSQYLSRFCAVRSVIKGERDFLFPAASRKDNSAVPLGKGTGAEHHRKTQQGNDKTTALHFAKSSSSEAKR